MAKIIASVASFASVVTKEAEEVEEEAEEEDKVEVVKDSLSLNVTEDIFELSNVEINADEVEREENDDKGGNNFCENDRNSEDLVGLG